MADFGIVVEKLHSFEDADALADYFRQYGVKAMPQEARSCAISVFVGMETGDFGNIVTTTREVTVEETLTDGYGYLERVTKSSIQHTHVMAQFVKNFDTGKYPFLIEDGYEYDPESVVTDMPCYCVECVPDVNEYEL